MFTVLLIVVLLPSHSLGFSEPGQPVGGGAHEQLPQVKIFHPVVQETNNFHEVRGKIQPANQVDIRPRIDGRLVQTFFKEGAAIKRGDLLFQLDPRPLQENVDKAARETDQDRASLTAARQGLEKLQAAEAKQPGSISKAQIDQEAANVERAAVRLRNSEKELETRKAKLGFTRITSPLDGVIILKLADPGRMLVADETLMGMIVSKDPVYVYFDVDETTYVRLRRAVRFRKQVSGLELPVQMSVEEGSDFTRTGKAGLAESQPGQKRGVKRYRAVFANPGPEKGSKLLVPGTEVRLRIPVDASYKLLHIPASSVSRQESGTTVLVIDSENRVQTRKVRVGPVQADKLISVVDGLRVSDWIVADPPQDLRPGAKVEPEKISLPGS
ncbi:efflux RND transporter periplasmic adaptor subunit [soil metagenome]